MSCGTASFLRLREGVDQRIIDDFVGHQTDEQRRRYRHLYPSTQSDALKSVFG
jgi:hypothetical protein